MRALLFGALLAGMTSALSAQNAGHSPDQRVRVTAPGVLARPIVGRVATVDSQLLSLTVTRKGSVVAIPLASISEMSASGGIDRGKGAGRGALVGLALGALLFADAYHEVRESDYWGLATPALAIVSFTVPPGLGALVGYAWAPERWERMFVPEERASARGSVAVRFTPDEDVRVRHVGGSVSGRVRSQTRELVTLATSDGIVTLPWRNVHSVSVRGEPSRKRGALRGAIVAVGITAIGVATDPLPSVGENVGVIAGNAAFGAMIGAFFPARGRTSLPVPRP